MLCEAAGSCLAAAEGDVASARGSGGGPLERLHAAIAVLFLAVQPCADFKSHCSKRTRPSRTTRSRHLLLTTRSRQVRLWLSATLLAGACRGCGWAAEAWLRSRQRRGAERPPRGGRDATSSFPASSHIPAVRILPGCRNHQLLSPPATMWRPRALAALLGLALLGLASGQGTWNCRMAKGSSHAGCGLPYQLSNFQG